MFTTRRTLLAGIALAVLTLGALWSINEVTAAKPPSGGGGDGHTGIIYFRAAPEYWAPSSEIATFQMFDDGSGKTMLPLPTGVYATPTSRLYGGDRWWIFVATDPVTGTDELFACRSDGSGLVQLTAIFDGDTAMRPSSLQWSNDGIDSFVSVGTETTIGENVTHRLLRLPIVGDIAAMQALNLLPLGAADCEIVLGPEQSYHSDRYTWSPDPRNLAYIVNTNVSEWNVTVRVRTLTDPPADVPILTADDIRGARWSPDGRKIAYWMWLMGGSTSIWTMNPDGSAQTRVLAPNLNNAYALNGWSWDSKELMLEGWRIYRAVGENEYNLVRMPAGGGKLTVLTRDLPPTGGKWMLNWVPLP